LVWRASVDLPESIVPVKNCSSATGRNHATGQATSSGISISADVSEPCSPTSLAS
jgi:hypothetical protein